MSAARAQRQLRLAHAAAPHPVLVLRDDDEATRADALVLVRPGRLVAPIAAPGRQIAVHLAVHGLAVRYLHRLLGQAGSCGWDLECLAAFAGELERRCSYLVAAGARLSIEPPSRRSRRRPQVALWRSGRWVLEGGALGLAEELVAGARARDDALLATISGAPQGRASRRLAAALRQDGVVLRTASPRAAGELGAPWAIEVVSVPRLTSEHLNGLRERFAVAPRCEWCALPVIGARCRRCTGGAVR